MTHEELHYPGYVYKGKYGAGAVCGVVGGALLILAGDDVTIAGILDDGAIPPTLVVGGTICTGAATIDAVLAGYGPYCGGWFNGGSIKVHVWGPDWWNPVSSWIGYPTCA